MLRNRYLRCPMQVVVIGGGAAGFFAALSCKAHHPQARVVLLEKTGKVLSKVKVSGGGRCNVTHACFEVAQLIKHYPRGGRQLKKAFHQFYTRDTIEWFQSRGVKLKTEADNRMFPTTDDSQTIMDCLMAEAKALQIDLRLQQIVQEIKYTQGSWLLSIKDQKPLRADCVIVATGGSPTLKGLDWLQQLGHAIAAPVPSLFTFNMPHEPIKSLMGVVAPQAAVHIQGTKLKSSGPLLITHWGMSGPAILKLSAFGARELHELQYNFKVQINWLNGTKEEAVRQELQESIQQYGKRKVNNHQPFDLPSRLWLFLLGKVGVDGQQTWNSLSKKTTNQLINTLLNDVYTVQGKTTFKEEFVTCGGVSLSDVDMQTMQSKKCPGLYFAGEVLDIDGVTGGFNFQAAWTTGFIAGQLT